MITRYCIVAVRRCLDSISSSSSLSNTTLTDSIAPIQPVAHQCSIILAKVRLISTADRSNFTDPPHHKPVPRHITGSTLQ